MWVTAESGFATGFDSFVAVDGPRTSSMIKPGLAGAAKWAWHALLCHDDDGANETTEILRSFLADRDERPFFWFVNLVECHSPYLPPRPYADRGPIARVKAARANRRHMTLGAIWRACLGGFDISDEDLALLRHFYEQSIRLLDDWLAQLLESLDAAGVLDDTLLIITSDHGENFGEGRLIGHTLSLDDRLLRVPFIATGPGAPVLRRVASLTELPRLVAEAIGLSDHPWGDSHLIDSIAVAQFDAPADRGPQATETMLEWGLGDGALDLLTSAQTAVTDGRFKLVRRAGTDVLFDLEADPLELHPQAPSSSPEALRKALERAAAEAAAPVSHGVVEPDRADLEERMRMLGYM